MAGPNLTHSSHRIGVAVGASGCPTRCISGQRPSVAGLLAPPFWGQRGCCVAWAP
jgi:hypothetical protein